MAVGIATREGAKPDTLERWTAEDRDLRFDEETAYQISAFLSEHHVVSVVMADRITGAHTRKGLIIPKAGFALNVLTGAVATEALVR